MNFDYAPLPLRRLGTDARLRAASPHGEERLTPDSPARGVMTDFATIPAATIGPAESIEEANRLMIRRGVRALIVIDHAERVIGILTASDVLGERPMQVALDQHRKHAEISVREIMTPAERIEVLAYERLGEARIGHIVATLQRSGRQHALVVQTTGAGDVVRGIFSLSQIASDLGAAIEVPQRAETFAEIEAALSR